MGLEYEEILHSADKLVSRGERIPASENFIKRLWEEWLPLVTPGSGIQINFPWKHENVNASSHFTVTENNKLWNSGLKNGVSGEMGLYTGYLHSFQEISLSVYKDFNSVCRWHILAGSKRREATGNFYDAKFLSIRSIKTDSELSVEKDFIINAFAKDNPWFNTNSITPLKKNKISVEFGIVAGCFIVENHLATPMGFLPVVEKTSDSRSFRPQPIDTSKLLQDKFPIARALRACGYNIRGTDDLVQKRGFNNQKLMADLVAQNLLRDPQTERS